jgi:hypothetical protein
MTRCPLQPPPDLGAWLWLGGKLQQPERAATTTTTITTSASASPSASPSPSPPRAAAMPLIAPPSPALSAISVPASQTSSTPLMTSARSTPGPSAAGIAGAGAATPTPVSALMAAGKSPGLKPSGYRGKSVSFAQAGPISLDGDGVSHATEDVSPMPAAPSTPRTAVIHSHPQAAMGVPVFSIASSSPVASPADVPPSTPSLSTLKLPAHQASSLAPSKAKPKPSPAPRAAPAANATPATATATASKRVAAPSAADSNPTAMSLALLRQRSRSAGPAEATFEGKIG